MKNMFLMLCGILTPVVYVITVILGGALWSSYSHIAQPVSDLIATGAPNKSLLDPLFGVYNLLTLVFGIGLFLFVRTAGQVRARTAGLAGALILISEGIFGILTLFFPEPAGGMSGPITGAGTMHIVFASLSSLTTMLTILLLGVWFGNNPHLRSYGMYSFFSVAIVFVSGGLAALSIGNQWPVGGLLERITMGGWLQWLFFVAWALYSLEGKRISTR